MSEYLKPNQQNLSVNYRQFLFKCRKNDIDIRANRPWKYQDIFCIACKDTNIEETGKHILECKNLVNKNDKLSYIPTYNNIYSDDLKEQVYTSKIIQENMKIRETYKVD